MGLDLVGLEEVEEAEAEEEEEEEEEEELVFCFLGLGPVCSHHHTIQSTQKHVRSQHSTSKPMGDGEVMKSNLPGVWCTLAVH